MRTVVVGLAALAIVVVIVIVVACSTDTDHQTCRLARRAFFDEMLLCHTCSQNTFGHNMSQGSMCLGGC